MSQYDSYEIVVGLEVHAQLLTNSKLFCGDSIAFGKEPNTHVSPITLGHPGTLPKMNKKAIEFAVKMGLACHCEIERYNYFAEIRKLVRYLGVCDGNMEEGSLRCDVNISVRKKGETKLGTKVEVKNLNSIRNAKRAVETEAERLIDLLKKGENIIQQTRGFDAGSGTTYAIRDKEDADDYRYFPEPDLTPFQLEDEFIETIRKGIPMLHEERIRKYVSDYKLSGYDAVVLTEEKSFSDYFEQIIQHTTDYKAAANWMAGPIKSWLNENNLGIESFPLDAEKLSALVQLVNSNKLSFSAASTKLFNALLKDSSKEPIQLAAELNLLQESNASAIEPIVDQVISKYADKVNEYKKGKKGLMGLFVGEVMKLSKGKADPKLTNDLLIEKLNS